jgi:hypothetical protein
MRARSVLAGRIFAARVFAGRVFAARFAIAPRRKGIDERVIGRVWCVAKAGPPLASRVPGRRAVDAQEG